jgi:apolipoprotein N-acyltransferase
MPPALPAAAERTAPPVVRSAARIPRWLDLAAALAAGALHSLPFAHTHAWPLQLALVAFLGWRSASTRPRRAAAIGFAFGTGWLAAGTWWLFVSMHRYGGLPAPLAAFAVLLLAAFLSLYLAAAMALFARLRSGRVASDAALFAACWLLAELARGVLFTGFPWVASGYAHVDGPLASLAPWIGVYGVGFAAAAVAFLAAQALPGWDAPRSTASRWGAVAFAGCLLAAAAIAGPGDHTRTSGTLSVSLLQTNVAQEEKFAPERMPQTLGWLAERLTSARSDLVVAPETAIPLLPEQLGPDYWNMLKRHFQADSRAALIGLPLGSFERGYTNSAAGLTRESAGLPGGFYRYDKYHLVPFGEFIPTGFRWFTDMMNIPLGDFTRGPLAAPSLAVREQRVAPNICYEDLFGEELATRFRDDDRAPTILANLSNIGWFGDTVAIEHHLHITRMRTLEFQRPMLRSTNTGATAIVDHRGRVTASLEPFTQGVLEGRVDGREGLTPYTRWVSHAGLWPLALLGAAVVGLALRGRPRP